MVIPFNLLSVTPVLKIVSGWAEAAIDPQIARLRDEWLDDFKSAETRRATEPTWACGCGTAPIEALTHCGLSGSTPIAGREASKLTGPNPEVPPGAWRRSRAGIDLDGPPWIADTYRPVLRGFGPRSADERWAMSDLSGLSLLRLVTVPRCESEPIT